MKRLPKKDQIVAVEREAQQRERIGRALRWSDGDIPVPDVMPPVAWGELTSGYTFNAYACRVDIAWSSSISHAVGQTEKTTSQHSLVLFSTRLLALRALRAAMELEFATKLAALDVQIEACSE